MSKAIKDFLVMSITWIGLVIASAWVLQFRLTETFAGLFLGFGTIVSDFFSAIFKPRKAT